MGVADLKFTGVRTYGWSRSTSAMGQIARPRNIEEIREVLENAEAKDLCIANRNAGRSYGDATLIDSEIILDTSLMNRILNWNPESGVIEVEPGVTIEQVLLRTAGDGWVFPVMPGTRFVSMAGALSNNVHGKNAYHQGYVGEHVLSCMVLLANGDHVCCGSGQNEELFHCIISGMGFIGVFTKITLQLRRVPSFYIHGKVRKFRSFGELIDSYDEIKKSYEYSIAWIDSLKPGAELGRGELHFGNFRNDQDFRITQHDVPKRLGGIVPHRTVAVAARVSMNRHTMRLVNDIQMRTSNMSADVDGEKISLSQYHYLMDMKFPHYNRFFRHGFFLYQPIVPFDRATAVYLRLMKMTLDYGFPSYMTGLKAYRSQRVPFLTTFELDGFSLTMDIPKVPMRIREQTEMFYRMNDIVIQNGGRIYLGKTSVATKEHLYAMYPRVNEFLRCKNKYDGTHRFQSNMYRRILRLPGKNGEIPSNWEY